MAIFEITLLFLGSIIGAGFATGAEIITFFGNLNLPVWLIASIVGLSMSLIITLEIFLFYQKKLPKNNTNQPIRVKLLHIVFVIIYLILFTAMTAGTTQITNIHTSLIMLAFSGFFALFGIKRLAKFNFYLVAVIFVLIITTALPHLLSQDFFNTPPSQWQNLPRLLFHALIYTGLNCFMFPELIFALSHTHKKYTLFTAGIMSSFLITLLLALILSTIQITGTQSSPIPLLAAAPNKLTEIIILLAIFTSQYTALFAIIQSLHQIIPKTKDKPLFTVICLCICAFIGSFFGFNHIIQIGYPLIGIFTCFYLLTSSLTKFWQHYHQP